MLIKGEMGSVDGGWEEREVLRGRMRGKEGKGSDDVGGGRRRWKDEVIKKVKNKKNEK